MSVSHNHRRKTIRQFKKKYGPKRWLSFFLIHSHDIRRANEGPLIGSVADLVSPPCWGSVRRSGCVG